MPGILKLGLILIGINKFIILDCGWNITLMFCLISPGCWSSLSLNKRRLLNIYTANSDVLEWRTFCLYSTRYIQFSKRHFGHHALKTSIVNDHSATYGLYHRTCRTLVPQNKILTQYYHKAAGLLWPYSYHLTHLLFQPEALMMSEFITTDHACLRTLQDMFGDQDATSWHLSPITNLNVPTQPICTLLPLRNSIRAPVSFDQLITAVIFPSGRIVGTFFPQLHIVS